VAEFLSRGQLLENIKGEVETELRDELAGLNPGIKRSQDIGCLFARLFLRDFLALLAGFGKSDRDCLLSALHGFAASAALESTLLAFMHRLLDLLRGIAWIFPGHLV
jgi:hypothetical protein